jgi:hypothetical protein
MDEIRTLMAELADALAEVGDFEMADRAAAAQWDSDEDLAQFVASDWVWGRPGSMADPAGDDDRNEQRIRVESTLVLLGRQQVELGVTNPRTQFWVEAFEQWATEEE